MNIEQLREKLAEARARQEALEGELTEIRSAATEEERDLSEDESKLADEKFAELEGVDAEEKSLVQEIEKREKQDARLKPQLRSQDALPARDPAAIFARAKDPDSEEKTYRPDKPRVSFMRDLLSAEHGDIEARERLQRNAREALEHYGWDEQDEREYRDNIVGSTTGSEFLPPLYLSGLYVEPNIAGRPLANALPSMPLPPTGIAITIPKLSSGVTTAARSDGGNVSETDAVTATVSHDVNEIAGHVDIGRTLVMRTDPAFDSVIVRTLNRRYDAYLDTQLLSGSGTAPQHRGLDNVTSPNTVTFTQATPTAANTLPQLFNAIQLIVSNRLEVFGDLIVMHPRRSAFINSSLSSTVPVFQQGQLVQAVGTQDRGFAQSLGGIEILMDPNITVTDGNPGTNQDRIYVMAREDFILMEGPRMARVWDDVGSTTGVIRYSVFAYSAFLSNRYPKSLTIISGTGLASPSFS